MQTSFLRLVTCILLLQMGRTGSVTYTTPRATAFVCSFLPSVNSHCLTLIENKWKKHQSEVCGSPKAYTRFIALPSCSMVEVSQTCINVRLEINKKRNWRGADLCFTPRRGGVPNEVYIGRLRPEVQTLTLLYNHFLTGKVPHSYTFHGKWHPFTRTYQLGTSRNFESNFFGTCCLPWRNKDRSWEG